MSSSRKDDQVLHVVRIISSNATVENIRNFLSYRFGWRPWVWTLQRRLRRLAEAGLLVANEDRSDARKVFYKPNRAAAGFIADPSVPLTTTAQATVPPSYSAHGSKGL